MTFSLEIAARTLFMEARGEPELGQRAVAHVLVNRLTSGRWGKTLASVCLFPFQFSCWNTNDPNRRTVAALPDDDALIAELRGFVEEATHGAADPTRGATHYYAASMSKPPDWIQGATSCGRIGNHFFYKDVR